MKYIICSIGHTAAGKTTTLKKISNKMNIPLISEGAIKRNLVGESFNINNSMDENLRSKGYKLAITQAFDILLYNNSVILDASFHQLFRRLWIYDEIAKRKLDDITVIWVYCFCNDIDKVKDRIDMRAQAKTVTADIQARSMKVYQYTMDSFNSVNITDFPLNINSTIIYNDTCLNKIIKSQSNYTMTDTFVNDIIEVIYG